jgi:hypothetical protein
MIYVPTEWKAQAQEWISRYKEIRKVLERLCEACVKRIQRREE